MVMENNSKELSQEQVWDKIAPFWNRDKKVPFGDDDKGNILTGFIEKSDKKILDLGCGSGRNFTSVKEAGFIGELTGVDFSAQMLKFAEINAKNNKLDVKLSKSNLWDLSFEDNYFDKIICIATLHCIEDKEKREKTLKEMYRVLKPKGKILITVWNKKAKRWKNKPKEKYVSWKIDEVKDEKVHRYYYLYDQEELIKELENVGFKILKINFPTARNIVIIAEK